MAQVAGFMGKRFSIGYANSISPAFFSPGPKALFSDADDGAWAVNNLNVTHELSIDYVLNSRAVFCFSPQYFRTGLSYNKYIGENQYYYYNPSDDRPIRLQCINLEAGIKLFNRRNMAPLGWYSKMEMIVFFDKLSLDKDALYKTPDHHFSVTPSEKYAQAKSTYNFKSMGFVYTVGKQRIFFNKMIVDMGLRFALVPSFLFKKIAYFSDIESELSTRADARIFPAQLVNFHIGIGFLAF